MEVEVAERLEQMEEEHEEWHTQLKAEYEETFESQRKGLNKARAEKRGAWNETKKARRKLRRVERDLKEIQEAEESAEECSPSDAEESEDEHSPLRPTHLGFEQLSRRDDKGRWHRRNRTTSAPSGTPSSAAASHPPRWRRTSWT